MKPSTTHNRSIGLAALVAATVPVQSRTVEKTAVIFSNKEPIVISDGALIGSLLVSPQVEQV